MGKIDEVDGVVEAEMEIVHRLTINAHKHIKSIAAARL